MELQASEILSIPPDQPERLFPSQDMMDSDFKDLAKKWHPDHGADPGVLAHINILRAAGKQRISKGYSWRVFRDGDASFFTLDTTRGHVEFKFLRSFRFSLGETYVGRLHSTAVLEAAHAGLRKRAVELIKSVKYVDTRERDAKHLLMPRIRSEFDAVDGRVGLTVTKAADQLLLRDLLAHLGGKMDPKHVAWIISRCYDHACFLGLQGIVPCDWSPDTLYVCPEHHSVAPLGGWWFAHRDGDKIGLLPKRTVNCTSPRLFADKVATIGITLDLIKALGRELLGDINGGMLMYDKSVPQAMRHWLMVPAGKDPVEDYKTWQVQVLQDSFGARKFVKLDVGEADVYK